MYRRRFRWPRKNGFGERKKRNRLPATLRRQLSTTRDSDDDDLRCAGYRCSILQTQIVLQIGIYIRVAYKFNTYSEFTTRICIKCVCVCSSILYCSIVLIYARGRVPVRADYCSCVYDAQQVSTNSTFCVRAHDAQVHRVCLVCVSPQSVIVHRYIYIYIYGIIVRIIRI